MTLLSMVQGMKRGTEIVLKGDRRRKDDVGIGPWERFWVYRESKAVWRWPHRRQHSFIDKGTAEEAVAALEKFLKGR